MFKIKLKKTKVEMYSSEHEIYKYVNEFYCKCIDERNCKECKVVKFKDKKEIMDSEKCLARYIYEKIIDIN